MIEIDVVYALILGWPGLRKVHEIILELETLTLFVLSLSKGEFAEAIPCTFLSNKMS